jgi:hypothetical protein
MIRLLALARFLVLSRQARAIRRIIEELPVSAQRAVGQLAMVEIQTAARSPAPHLYGSEDNDRYQPWGDAASLAFTKAQSKIPQLKLRGLALWLAVTFHETSESPHSHLRAVHRDVLGMLGLLKGTYAANAMRQVTAEAA